MTCGVPIRECLEWHYKPKLAPAKITKRGLSIQARCPAHKNAGRESLTISAGEHLRAVWHCHAGCDGATVRRALITAGIPASCVPAGNGTETTQGEVLDAILTDTTTSPAVARLRALAVRQGHAQWPKGKELEQLAKDAGLRRTMAFDAAKTGLLVPAHLTASYSPPEAGPVKSGKTSQVSDVVSRSKESGQADRSAHADCPKSGQADSQTSAVCVEPKPSGRRGGRQSKVTPADHREFHRLRAEGMSALKISRHSKLAGGKLTASFSEMTVFAWLKKPPPDDEEGSSGASRP